MFKKKKPKKISPTLEFMRKTREEEWERIQEREKNEFKKNL